MSIKIWKILDRGVLPNGKKHQRYDFIIVEDNFHDRESNDYIIIASEPLEKEDVQQLISGVAELSDFELSYESADNYSDEAWELAKKLEVEDWQLILQELD